MRYTCPICGYPELKEPAYDSYGSPSYDICYSCGYQFGFTDDCERITLEQWRVQWIAGGMKWNSVGRKQPENWNPQAQLLNIIDSGNN